MGSGQWAVLFALLRLVADPPRISESVVVTAAGDGRIAAVATATVLTREALDASPSFTLDQQLGATPGFSLFRRNSSRTANPTTQGVTLRGLAASGASRTLVVSDGVPLNDPFGGWVYWNRVPGAAIDRVDIVRGGSSDLFGSDAMAGAVRVMTRRDTAAELRLEGGGGDARRVSAYAGRAGAVSMYAGAEAASMGGYVPVAPESRGPIDTPAGSRHWSGLVRAGLSLGPAHVEGGGAWLSEDRDNGTPAQRNATRLAGAFASARGGLLGGYWDISGRRQTQDYDQTFSAVAEDRASERLTTGQAIDVMTQAFDASWARQGRRAAVMVSAFGSDTTADSISRSFLPNGAILSISGGLPGQRSLGGTAQIVATPVARLTLTAGFRAELRSLQHVRDYTMAGPRVGASWRIARGVIGRVSASSSYRAPTMNELYRSFRVGDVLTLANVELEPERSRGAEAALTITRGPATVRGVAFLSRVDGTIYSRTLTGVERPGIRILRERANGDAASRGVELEAEMSPVPGVSLWAAATALDSTFTSGELDGRRLPQVPSRQAAAGGRIARGSWAASVDLRHASSQFDDDRNVYELRSATTMNALVAWRFRYGQVFAAVENLFDADIDAGRTPLRTIGQPRVWQAGIRIRTR